MILFNTSTDTLYRLSGVFMTIKLICNVVFWLLTHNTGKTHTLERCVCLRNVGSFFQFYTALQLALHIGHRDVSTHNRCHSEWDNFFFWLWACNAVHDPQRRVEVLAVGLMCTLRALGGPGTSNQASGDFHLRSLKTVISTHGFSIP
jgi:hypothetical protein